MKTERLIYGVLFLIMAILLAKCNTDAKTANNMLLASQDSMRIERDKSGRQVATIRVLEGEIDSWKTLINSKDTTIAKLGRLIKEERRNNLKMATVLSNTTSVSGISETTITDSDTVIKDSVVYVFPKYETAWDDRWGIGRITATKDSILREILIRNEFEITHTMMRDKWHEPKYPVISIKNLNPNTETNEMRTYTPKAKKHRRGYIFVGGILVGLLIAN